MINNSNPAMDGIAITPNDGADLAQEVRAIYCGVAGDIKIDTPEGTALTFVGVQAGSVLPIHADKVYATGTDATNLIGLI